MGNQEGVRRMVEVSLEQGVWLDNEMERTPMSRAEIIHEGILRLQAGPPAEPRLDRLNFPYEERPGRLATMHLEDALWIDEESKRVGIHRAELVRQALERLQRERQRVGD